MTITEKTLNQRLKAKHPDIDPIQIEQFVTQTFAYLRQELEKPNNTSILFNHLGTFSIIESRVQKQAENNKFCIAKKNQLNHFKTVIDKS